MGKVEIAGIVAVRVHDGLYQSEYGELSVERQENGEWLASYFQIDCHIIVPGASAQDAAERLALVAHSGVRAMRAASNGRTKSGAAN